MPELSLNIMMVLTATVGMMSLCMATAATRNKSL